MKNDEFISLIKEKYASCINYCDDASMMQYNIRDIKIVVDHGTFSKIFVTTASFGWGDSDFFLYKYVLTKRNEITAVASDKFVIDMTIDEVTSLIDHNLKMLSDVKKLQLIHKIKEL